MVDWQPIKTAPRDHGQYLFYYPASGGYSARMVVDGFSNRQSIKPDTRRYREYGDHPYTHWAPLPEPPK